ncbi:hypothetical protein T01_10156 [Trichinella spiralis]|uniref:Uncharacterized protein n=1 Tax=Trichinella spiralis TaxID=6334 RepID=A0A0V1B375_TRISP|nr:hypothetical protein T01_10156 [Trichinella spiralis]
MLMTGAGLSWDFLLADCVCQKWFSVVDAEEKRKVDKYGYELNFEPADGFDMLARRERISAVVCFI